MAEKNSNSDKLGRYPALFKKYMTKMSSLFSSRAGADVYTQLKNGKTQYLRYERTESSSFDMNWIKEIEDIIFDLGEIVKNPKKTTKVEETIVPAELARKTNATSVRHLASHTQFIKEIDDEGNVTPSKILNIGSEDEYSTYENRFVATLIRRLVLFIEKRYEYINEFAELKDAEVLMFKNKSYVDGKEVEIETKIKILSDNDATGTGNNSVYVNRIKEIRRYIRFYYNSTFMKMFKNERDVRNPIIMTNILRKNPLYRHCYELYKFIESYDTLGVNFKINEKFADFSDAEMEEINATLLANFLTCKGKDPEKGYLKNTTKQYKPRVLTSIDDEEFAYSKLIKGPIEFVRVDEDYMNYLQMHDQSIPEKPKKEEKEYYKEEIRRIEEQKALERATRALLARKKKQEKEWNKEAERLVARRLKEEEEARIKAEKEARALELARIAAAREELKQEAKADHSMMKAEEKRVEKVTNFNDALRALKDQEELEQEEIQENADINEEKPLEAEQEENPEQEEKPLEDEQNASKEENKEEASEEVKDEANEELNKEEVQESEETVNEEPSKEEVPIEEQVEEKSLEEEAIPEEAKDEVIEEPIEEKSEEIAESIENEPIEEPQSNEEENIEEPISKEEAPTSEEVPIEESQSEQEQGEELVANEEAAESQEEAPIEDSNIEEPIENIDASNENAEVNESELSEEELAEALKALSSQAEEDFFEEENVEPQREEIQQVEEPNELDQSEEIQEGENILEQEESSEPTETDEGKEVAPIEDNEQEVIVEEVESESKEELVEEASNEELIEEAPIEEEPVFEESKDEVIDEPIEEKSEEIDESSENEPIDEPQNEETIKEEIPEDTSKEEPQEAVNEESIKEEKVQGEAPKKAARPRLFGLFRRRGKAADAPKEEEKESSKEEVKIQDEPSKEEIISEEPQIEEEVSEQIPSSNEEPKENIEESSIMEEDQDVEIDEEEDEEEVTKPVFKQRRGHKYKNSSLFGGNNQTEHANEEHHASIKNKRLRKSIKRKR